MKKILTAIILTAGVLLATGASAHADPDPPSSASCPVTIADGRATTVPASSAVDCKLVYYHFAPGVPAGADHRSEAFPETFVWEAHDTIILDCLPGEVDAVSEDAPVAQPTVTDPDYYDWGILAGQAFTGPADCASAPTSTTETPPETVPAETTPEAVPVPPVVTHPAPGPELPRTGVPGYLWPLTGLALTLILTGTVLVRTAKP